jgi:hypothetical protein
VGHVSRYTGLPLQDRAPNQTSHAAHTPLGYSMRSVERILIPLIATTALSLSASIANTSYRRRCFQTGLGPCKRSEFRVAVRVREPVLAWESAQVWEVVPARALDVRARQMPLNEQPSRSASRMAGRGLRPHSSCLRRYSREERTHRGGDASFVCLEKAGGRGSRKPLKETRHDFDTRATQNAEKR